MLVKLINGKQKNINPRKIKIESLRYKGGVYLFESYSGKQFGVPENCILKLAETVRSTYMLGWIMTLKYPTVTEWTYYPPIYNDQIDYHEPLEFEFDGPLAYWDAESFKREPNIRVFYTRWDRKSYQIRSEWYPMAGGSDLRTWTVGFTAKWEAMNNESER